ncbi:MAG: hypothetical protein FWG94_05275 [Oscillospiraceae bacterium]|nr:hypothetical protein [Oscillospiraceae bacterium]
MAGTISGIIASLGGPVLVAVVMFILGLVFQAGFSASLRGGLYSGIGLASLFVIVNNATDTLTPVILAFSERFGRTGAVTDLGWGSAGIAFAWPGLAFTLLGIIIVNAIMVLTGLVKTMWTDVWSFWHGQVVGGFVWALSGGNITLGVVAAIIFLVINSYVGDFTAKTYQEFNGLPGISVPCCVTLLALPAIPVNALFEKIPWFNKLNASPEAIRKKIGIAGELGVMGTIIGIVLGFLGGNNFAGALNLGIQIGVLMVFLPKTVSVLCEGVIPIANAVTEFVQERFEGKKEVYVAVDCAALLGHPSVMASAVLLYPLCVILAIFLPGNAMIPIASLALIPYWCGAIAPYFKGNVIRMVLFVLLWIIPVLIIATVNANLHTLTMGNLGLADPAVLNSSLDMGGDPLGYLLIKIFGLFA